MVCLAKLTCKLEEQIRVHDYLLQRCFLIAKESDFSQAGKRAMVEYSKKTKGKKGHGEGRPEQTLFRTFVVVSLKLAKAAADEEGMRHLIDFIKQYKHPKDIPKESLGYCRLSDTHEVRDQPHRRRIMLAAGTNATGIRAMDTVIKYICIEGATEQEGVAPKGGVARKIQELLDNMPRDLKKNKRT